MLAVLIDEHDSPIIGYGNTDVKQKNKRKIVLEY